MRTRARNIKGVVIALGLLAVMMLVTQACQPPAQAGELELGLTAAQGESRTASYLLGLKDKLGPISLDASYRYGTTNDETTTDQGYLNLAWDHDLSDRWSGWVFNRSGFNNVRGIDMENFLGVGPKLYLIKDSHTRLSLSIGYLNQYTEYSGGSGETVHRMSYRPKLSWINDGAEFRAVFFYQPSLRDPDDYITITEASYRVAINDALALKATVEDEYRSVAQGARHETLQYISLTVRFK